ncbi:uncharacterized protein LOC121413446 [Lytechinus variegatus]|uniref:uncharacterized protein LOC121413446 n=1 Tax=Lytechinus variegatus TaxID=7654 RepID=UPI001BB123E7|nr:uncharacterized protein LOC121413446 [Lytechinus variegatus]
MDPADKEKTAFTTGTDFFQFTVMPMGLRNAPSTFQRLMQLVLRGLHWESVLVYLDDVIVFGRSFEEKLVRLRAVFDRLRAAGLKLRPDKCNFFKEKVTFLGHVISPTGVLPDPANIDKVRSWPTPKNVTELRAFLGLCSYYRRFVKSFAHIAQPLYNLIQKGAHFSWSGDCEHAFHTLRHTLISPPLMSFPDFSQPFTLHTDASNFAVGAVLTQQHGNDEHVIAYASKTLTPSERRWSTYDRELWALVWSVRHFRHYLLTSKFTIITDHKPLVGLTKLSVGHDAGIATSRRSRWALELDTFDWIIVHREGAKHANADALSRIPSPSEHHCVATVSPASIPPPPPHPPAPPPPPPPPLPSTPLHTHASPQLTHLDQPPIPPLFTSSVSNLSSLGPHHSSQPSSSSPLSPPVTTLQPPSPISSPSSSSDENAFYASLLDNGHRLHQAQHADPTLRLVKSWTRSGLFPPRSSIPSCETSLRKFHSERDRLEVCDGLLCRRKRLPSGSLVKQVVIPHSLVPDVLSILHGSPLSGHFGTDKMVLKADSLCFWPGMRVDIAAFCSRCIPCQRRRAPVPALRAPLKPISASKPFQRIAVDITELPITPRGNRYVLVIMDYFTKYVNLYPMANQKATTVVDCLFDKFVCQHGIPESIHSDQGRQF